MLDYYDTPKWKWYVNVNTQRMIIRKARMMYGKNVCGDHIPISILQRVFTDTDPVVWSNQPNSTNWQNRLIASTIAVVHEAQKQRIAQARVDAFTDGLRRDLFELNGDRDDWYGPFIRDGQDIVYKARDVRRRPVSHLALVPEMVNDPTDNDHYDIEFLEPDKYKTTEISPDYDTQDWFH